MANLNRVLLMGNLTRDPEVRYTPKGTAVADLGLAINRVIVPEEGERREEVTYVSVTLWGRQAEVAREYLTKGRGVFIEGRLHLDSWDDKPTGQKRSKLKVVGEHLQLLPKGGGHAPGEAQPGGAAPADNPSARFRPVGAAPALRPQPPPDPDLDEEADDDVPF